MNSTVALSWSRVLLSAWAGLVGGVGIGAFFKTDGTSWTASGVIALMTGIVFAVAAWSFEPRWRRERAQIEGGLPRDKLRVARRAAERGPVPADAEIRAAAARIASRGLARSRWQPGPKLIAAMGGVMLIGTAGAAADGSPWAFLYAASGCTMVYTGLFRPRQLRRRIELLSTPDRTR
jgi:hypothetical protein